METNDIQNLLDFIARSGLDEVNIETNDLKLSVKRFGQGNVVLPAPVATPAPVAVPTQPVAAPVTVAPPVAAPTPAASVAETITIKSPMIGTFYRSANPDSPMFVEVGDEVKVGKVVCIIEAMKLFNEIESDISGRVVKILVENATPVEYDQPLFLLEAI
jgi:acetyl-CoA carboxylase biotin carboxyl carrier protein